MAKQIITQITDDLDGSDAHETVHFSIDGVGYEIDLSDKNASEFRKFLNRYQDAGTRTGKIAYGQHAQVARYGQSKAPSAGLNREQNQKIRTWAAENGWELAERGRIPQHIVDSFETKTPNPEWLAKQEAARKVEAEVKPTTRAPRAAKTAAVAKPAPKAEFVKA